MYCDKITCPECDYEGDLDRFWYGGRFDYKCPCCGWGFDASDLPH